MSLGSREVTSSIARSPNTEQDRDRLITGAVTAEAHIEGGAKTMRRLRLLLLILLGVVLTSAATLAAPVPGDVKSVVAFIFVKDAEGKLQPNGTGFFVGVPNPHKEGNFAVYFVTAKHVVQKPDRKSFHAEIFIRINAKDGGSQTGSLPVTTAEGALLPLVSTDESVDLAVFPFFPDPTRFDVKFLPAEMITTKEAYAELKIREGSDVFFTGLFSPYPGSERNHPVVRFGRVALVTEEKIVWDGVPTDLYLIESGSYGGNSGSPVFFYLGSDREPGSVVVGAPVMKLAGIMKGAFLDVHPIQVVETNKVPVAPSNMGIAAVVPAYKLHELLFSEKLVSQRGF